MLLLVLRPSSPLAALLGAAAVALSVLLAVRVQPVHALGTPTTAKRVPGLGALLAFKANEAAQLGVDPEEPHSLLANLLDSSTCTRSDPDTAGAPAKIGPYGPHTFTQPLDHFHNSTSASFRQRFWVSTRHYNPRANKPTPIYIVDGGETSGANRIPFLEQGILDILAEATGGIAIVLEHRYYGASKPKLSDIGNKTYWDVDALRWLTNEQALEDSARFMRLLKVPGVDADLTAAKNPHIYIGGSYAGARSAHMRVLYPDIVFGAISTSGVTAAIDAYPQYYFPIARGSEPACSQAIQAAVAAFDAIAVPAHYNQSSAQSAEQKKRQNALRKLFKVDDLDWDDLANLITAQLGYFQALNWDPAVSSPGWDNFCDVMTNRTVVKAKESSATHNVLLSRVSSPSKRAQLASARSAYEAGFERSSVSALRAELRAEGLDGASVLGAESGIAGNPGDNLASHNWLPDELFRLASYTRAHFIEPCKRSGSPLRKCFSTKGPEAWRDFVHAPRLGMEKAWTWQVCTQWGYFQGAAPAHPSIANRPGPSGGGGRIVPHTPPTDSFNAQRPMMATDPAVPVAVAADGTPFDALSASSLFDERAASTAYTPGPKIVSSLLTLSYVASYCADAFPSTEHVRVPDRPDIHEVNRLGAFDIGHGVDRLAIINGQWDPWRPATPHSEEFAGGGGRTDTLLRPFKLIPNCWHHCDQNGLPSKDRKAGKEPERIRKIHEEEVAFVRAWLLQWGKSKK